MDGGWMDEEGAASTRDGAVDLPYLLRAIGRRKWWIIVPTCAGFVLALAVIVALPARYTGVAKVLLENQESYFTRPDKAAPEQVPTLDAEAVQSQVETITSPDLARKAIAELALADWPEFNQAASPDLLSVALSMVGVTGAPARRFGEEPIVEKFLSRLNAFPVAKTRVLQIEFASQDPELAARGANIVAQLFLDAQEKAKQNEAKAASAWLATKIEELRGKVADADAKVESYRAEAGLLAGANNMTIPGQQLAELNTQLTSARSAQSAALAKTQVLLAMLRDGRTTEVPELVKDESLRRYSEQRVALKAQIALEQRTLLPGHPHMKELTAQLAGLDSEIRAAIERAARGSENDARLAAAQVEFVKSSLAAQSKTVASGNVDEVQLRALELDARSARDQLESYLQKYREAIARDADNASPADARVISVAVPPRYPSFPKKVETLILGTLAGLVLSTGIVMSEALLSGGSGAPRVEAQPVVAGRKEEGPADNELESDEPLTSARSAPAASDAELRSPDDLAEYLAAANPSGAATLALIAGEDSDSSASTALAVARNLSGRASAVLVDLGANRDWLAQTVHSGGDVGGGLVGLAEVIVGEVSFAQAIHRDSSSSLDVIAPGESVLSTDGLEDVLEALAASYVYVIVHASDWRLDAALAVLDSVHQLVVIAPASRLRDSMFQARQAKGGPAGDVVGFVDASGRSRMGKAA